MKKILITSAAIVATTVGGLAFANTIATPSVPQNSTQIEQSFEKGMRKGPNPAMQTAIEANDFAAFQNAVKDTPMNVVDTQDEFNQLVSAHAAMKNGDATQMDALRTSLGLPEMKKGGRNHNGRHDEKNDAKREAVQAAIEANDFAAFTSAVKDSPLSVVDTQEEFVKFSEAEKTLRSAHENMEKVREELGIQKPEMKEMGKKGKGKK